MPRSGRDHGRSPCARSAGSAPGARRRCHRAHTSDGKLHAPVTVGKCAIRSASGSSTCAETSHPRWDFRAPDWGVDAALLGIISPCVRAVSKLAPGTAPVPIRAMGHFAHSRRGPRRMWGALATYRPLPPSAKCEKELFRSPAVPEMADASTPDLVERRCEPSGGVAGPVDNVMDRRPVGSPRIPRLVAPDVLEDDTPVLRFTAPGAATACGSASRRAAPTRATTASGSTRSDVKSGGKCQEQLRVPVRGDAETVGRDGASFWITALGADSFYHRSITGESGKKCRRGRNNRVVPSRRIAGRMRSACAAVQGGQEEEALRRCERREISCFQRHQDPSEATFRGRSGARENAHPPMDGPSEGELASAFIARKGRGLDAAGTNLPSWA